MRPLLGIALPTYNRADSFKLTLESVCREASATNGAVSVLVCDNASQDATQALVGAAQRHFPALRAVRHPANIGGVANILRCIESAESQWVWVMPDDCVLEPGILQRLILRLKKAQAPLLYTRCATWTENDLDLHAEIPVETMYGSHGEIWQHLSWLPCLVLNRDAVLRHLPQAYRLGNHSYPHLVLALKAVCEVSESTRLMVEPKAFRTQQSVGQTKRYTWIHGALWHFAQTLRACLPAAVAGPILRRCARTERLGPQVLACMPSEFEVLPPMTPWSLVRHYGVGMTPALLVFLWLRYVPRVLNRAFLTLACKATVRGPLSRLNSSLRRLRSRLEPGHPGMETDF